MAELVQSLLRTFWAATFRDLIISVVAALLAGVGFLVVGLFAPARRPSPA